MQVVATIYLKQYIANTNIFGFIISKFSYQQKVYLVILFKISKNLKVYSYYTILFFYFLINTEIKNSKKTQFGSKKIV